ncbi:MAG TPA: AmmeMemoRadiSam system protein B [Smithella sp.]|nr:AmmeMemoRadiSam system protein B [Smithella sp.]
MKTFRVILILLCIGSFFASACRADKKPAGDIREPAVAGKFYPENADKLKRAIEYFLRDAIPGEIKKPVALIVPHAGYIFSGQICADGFNQVRNQQYDTVVILGTNHTGPDFRKVSLYSGDGFRTPLGTAHVDKNIVSALKKAAPDLCIPDQSLHEREHSLEVVVPFVQTVFPRARIVPVVVASTDMETAVRFGNVLASVLHNKNVLIVASSDLSHYPAARDADIVDRETLAAIATLDPSLLTATLKAHAAGNIDNLSTSVCGEAPVIAAMAAAKSLGAVRGKMISYANSGDTSIGDRSRVVGYGAVVLTKDNAEKNAPGSVQQKPAAGSARLGSADKKALLAFARETLSRIFLTDTVPLPRGFSADLQQPRGVFVTLRKQGELRGCIGHMIADEPLAKLVGAMALQAAFNDSRFMPLSPEELKDVEIEISVLTPMKKVSGPKDIVAGRDGVLINKDGASAVFLPQVATEQGWNRDTMLDNLCRKAGLEKSCWKAGARFSTFQALVFSESQMK